VREELWPYETLAGLNEIVQFGTAGFTVTPPVQVLVAPELLTTVRVHVWVAAGEKAFVPLAPESVPLPRSPVQAYAICPSASPLDVQFNTETSPEVIIAGLKDTVQLGTPELTLTLPAHVLVAPELLVTVRVQV
jgi:hypothetical protein